MPTDYKFIFDFFLHGSICLQFPDYNNLNSTSLSDNNGIFK